MFYDPKAWAAPQEAMATAFARQLEAEILDLALELLRQASQHQQMINSRRQSRTSGVV